VRVLLVGNGPSLNQTPLDRLNYDISAGVNRVHLFYPKTTWRPDFYVYGDRSRGLDFVPDLVYHIQENDYPCYVRADIGRQGELGIPNGLSKNLYEYPNYLPFVECPHASTLNKHADSWHLPHLCKYGGSIYIAAQIAVYEYQATELIFVGCDLGYKAHKMNNFSPDYHDIDAYNLKDELRVDDTLIKAHKIIKKECDERGIAVYNATIGGNLDVYPRMDIKELM
jgi:hypothetical protein